MPSWLRRVPVLRTYAAVRELRDRNAALRDEVLKAREERDRTRKTLSHALPYGRMKEIVTQHAQAYQTADPFPHVVLDGLFDPALLKQILVEFDGMDRGKWHSSDKEFERKWATEDIQHFGPTTRTFINQLNGGLFLNFLERLTGIQGLISDPHLRGGGLHEIRREGALGVHADFNLYPRLNLWRRLNLLLYLNDEWDPAWGGATLILDDRGRLSPASNPSFDDFEAETPSISIGNYSLLFRRTDHAWHGVRELRCPAGRLRKLFSVIVASDEPGKRLSRVWNRPRYRYF
jgi:hypothetical protein